MEGLPCKPSIFGTIPLGRGGVIEGGCGLPPSIPLVVENYKQNPLHRRCRTKTNYKKTSLLQKKTKPLFPDKKPQTESSKRPAEDSFETPQRTEFQPYLEPLSVPLPARQHINHRTDSLTQHPTHDPRGFRRGDAAYPLYIS